MKILKIKNGIAENDILNPDFMSPEERWAVLYEYFMLRTNPFENVNEIEFTTESQSKWVLHQADIKGILQKRTLLTHYKIIKNVMRYARQYTMSNYQLCKIAGCQTLDIDNDRHFVVDRLDSGDKTIYLTNDYFPNSTPHKFSRCVVVKRSDDK